MAATMSSMRRLSAEREREILATVIQLLQEVGYQGLTMPAVAQRSHCSTATIYRRWEGKPGLVIAALLSYRPSVIPEIGTGSLRGDLHALVAHVAEFATSETTLIFALAHAATNDAELAEVMRAEIAGSVGSAFAKILSEAVARGEVRADNPAQAYCHLLLFSLPMGRFVIDGQPSDLGYLHSFVDAILIPSLLDDTASASSDRVAHPTT